MQAGAFRRVVTTRPTCTPTPMTSRRRAARMDISEVSVVTTPAIQKSPAGTFESAVAAGAAKANLSWWRVLLLGIVAGAYISLGGLLALSVGGSVPNLKMEHPGLQRLLFGLVGLPTGLTMVVAAGGELFTGNTALVSAAWFSGRAKLSGLMRNWSLSFLGNLIGSLLIVKMAVLCGALSGVSGSAAAAVAIAKTGLPFGVAFLRGVVCNWLVCLAVYMAGGAGDLVSKFIAIVLPISAFVAMGMEHSVANMFLIPAGIKAGADVGIKAFLLKNLLPVTLGNIFAGVVLVAGVYFLAYGKK